MLLEISRSCYTINLKIVMVLRSINIVPLWLLSAFIIINFPKLLNRVGKSSWSTLLSPIEARNHLPTF